MQRYQTYTVNGRTLHYTSSAVYTFNSATNSYMCVYQGVVTMAYLNTIATVV